jgi:rhodanese-related sulfurtransferase
VTAEIRAKYAKQIRFVFRQFPLVRIHPFAERMAEASECAGEQGKFWEAVDKIYSRQTDLSEDGLKRDAAEIGLDQAKFDACMASGAEAARVQRDREDGKALGVNATPEFFAGRQVVPNVPDFAELSRIIDEELAEQGIIPNPPVAPAASARAETRNPSSAKVVAPKAAPTQPTAEAGSSSFGGFGSPGGAFGGFSGGGIACSDAEAAMKQPTLINTNQLQGLLSATPKPLFVDVRSPKEYAAGHIPDAINIPIDTMPERWNTLPQGRVIIFYESGRASGDICAAGRAAGRILLQRGYAFDLVKVYQDGLMGWEKSGL